MSSSFGPWLSLALFHFLGNRWHARDCRLVLGSGLLLMAAPLALMCRFDDDQTLEAQQRRAQQAAGPLSGEQPAAGSEPLQGRLAEPAACPAGGEPASCQDGISGSAAAAGAAGEAEEGAAGPLASAGNGHASHTTEAATGSACALPPAAAAPFPSMAGPSASDLLSLPELAGSAKAQRGQPAAGCCAWVPPGLAVTLLISFSDFIGAMASGEHHPGSTSVVAGLCFRMLDACAAVCRAAEQAACTVPCSPALHPAPLTRPPPAHRVLLQA